MIRPLSRDEIFQYAGRLLEGGVQLHRPAPLNPERFAKKWEALFYQGAGQVFGYWKGEELGATLGAIVYRDLYDDQPIAQEIFLNIRPECRSSIGWRSLFPAYIEWAKEKGATTIFLSHWASYPRLGDVYTKLGFTPSETYYRLDVKGGENVIRT